MFEISASSTSVGIDITTGPGIPSLATLNALEIIFGKSSIFLTNQLCLVQGLVIPVVSHSWNAVSYTHLTLPTSDLV